jgi:MSHA biogenesis protein MshP
MSARSFVRHSFQRGIGLVGAIIVLVLMAGIGAAVVTLNTNQQTVSAMDVMQSRALLAARSGLEWGLLNWRVNNGACPNPPVTFPMPAGTSISPFRVTVRCEAAGNLVRISVIACNITAGACPVMGNVLNADYVEREVYADVPLTPI